MLSIRLFGSIQIELDGVKVALSRRKPLGLLAYLAVTARPHGREALAALFWPDSASEQAYAYLRNALWILNQTPLAPWLETAGDSIALHQNEGVEIDVVRFRVALAAVHTPTHPDTTACEVCLPQLVEAVEIAGGEFMAGFTLEDCPAFDDWQFGEADQLHRTLSNTLAKLVTYYSAAGTPASALTYAHRWQMHDPLNEDAHRSLMTLYAASGQRAAALHQYEALIRSFRAERLEPSHETIELYRHIREGQLGDPKPSPTGGVSTAVRPATPSALPERPLLPVQTTRFVGRESELAQLRDLLESADFRLITITGPGGIGKTRLALQLTERVAGTFRDGVAYTPCAALSCPEYIIPAIVHALGLAPFQSAEIDPESQLAAYLADKQLLLVLDNMEHLAGGVSLVGALLQAAPALKVLATSRERLALHGEAVMPLQGLDVPETDTEPSLPTSEAVLLFVDSARRTNVRFNPSEVDFAAIGRICRLLGGMPLGIELAAAWVKLLTCPEIADEIATSLDFLAASLRDLPERHQSLRAVFARSWGLLEASERRLFGALSVFRGTFSRAAAQRIAEANLAALAGLVDKSMVRVTNGRYEILEVLRQYGIEQLDAQPGERETTERRHAVFYLGEVAQCTDALKGIDAAGTTQADALAAIEQDLANIREAWRWALAHGVIAELGEAALGLTLFFDIRSRYQEGAVLLGDAVAAVDATGDPESAGFQSVLAALLMGLGELSGRLGAGAVAQSALSRGLVVVANGPRSRRALMQLVWAFWLFPAADHEQVDEVLREAIAECGELGDRWGEALGLAILGERWSKLARYAEAESPVRRSLAIRTELGDRWGMAMSWFVMGMLAEARGDAAEATAAYRESLALRELLRDTWGCAICQQRLGLIAWHTGDLLRAERCLLAAQAGFRNVADRRSLASCLAQLAELLSEQGRDTEAEEWLSESRGLHTAL